MKSLLLAALLLAGTQEWCWDDVGQQAIGYRFYWGYTGQAWLQCNRVDIPRYCPEDLDGDGVMDCCLPFDPELSPGQLVYYVVTSYNSVSESDTGHGPVDPDPCP